jgi:hypothetical protein
MPIMVTTNTNNSRGRPAARKASTICQISPLTLLGVSLIVAQIAILNIGMAYFRGEELQQLQGPSSSSSSSSSSQTVHSKASTVASPTKKKAKVAPDANADGSFNGYPIYHRTSKGKFSLSHCVGENYQEGKAWMHRSCRFSFLCFDTDQKEYVVFQNQDEIDFLPFQDKRKFLDTSQSFMRRNSTHINTMSLGGINIKWGEKEDGIGRLEWFPQIRTANSTKDFLSYYELPPEVIFVPFHSLNGANPGHLVWDDFLPIYTLMTMFQMEDHGELLMMRYVLQGERGLWASCDWKDEKTEDCEKMQKKFLPLMVGLDTLHQLTTTKSFNFEPAGDKKSNLVCAKHGLAGIGSLTDHGTKTHGWIDSDYETTHNHGRGGLLFEFRNFMLSNIGVPTEFYHKPPFRIVFSEKSSEVQTRHIDFTTQIDLLRKSFHPKYISIESYVFKDLSLTEQMQIASQTSIFISGCGGGAVTATFLPKGASVILYYLEDGGVVNNKPTGTPARLDWDLFNNLAYLKVFWLPKRTMHTETDLRALGLLVQHELDAMIRENGYDFF